MKFSERQIILFSIVLGLVYGLVTRLIFGIDKGMIVYQIMSVTYLFIVPVALGFVSVFWHDRDEFTFWNAVVHPWIPSVLTIFFAMALGWEGLICAIVWVPIFLLMSSIGGIIGYLVLRSRLREFKMLWALVAIGPLFMSQFEQTLPTPELYSTTHSKIEISADRGTIWNLIKEVAPITDEETEFSISRLIGFPKPIAASLMGEGVGSIRHATFEGQVLFIETVTEWETLNRISFTIEPGPNIPPTTFDQHVVVGGQYFDVLQGTYWIEDKGNDGHILHLTSDHKLNTRFNWYTRWWTDFFMNDIQENILEVIKKRSERSTPSVFQESILQP